MNARPQNFYRTFLSFIGTKKARISDASDLKLRIDDDKQRIAEEMGSYFANSYFNLATSSTHFGEHCSVKVSQRC